MVVFARFSSAAAELLGHPVTFLAALAGVLAWALSGFVIGFTDTWQLIIGTGTTILTFLAIFLVQSTQNRDTKAIQAKLDELVLSMEEADDAIAGIEKDDD